MSISRSDVVDIGVGMGTIVGGGYDERGHVDFRRAGERVAYS